MLGPKCTVAKRAAFGALRRVRRRREAKGGSTLARSMRSWKERRPLLWRLEVAQRTNSGCARLATRPEPTGSMTLNEHNRYGAAHPQQWRHHRGRRRQNDALQAAGVVCGAPTGTTTPCPSLKFNNLMVLRHHLGHLGQLIGTSARSSRYLARCKPSARSEILRELRRSGVDTFRDTGSDTGCRSDATWTGSSPRSFVDDKTVFVRQFVFRIDCPRTPEWRQALPVLDIEAALLER